VSLLSLLRTASELQREVDERLARIGLSLTKLVALQALAEAGEPMALTTLAERLACVKSNITQLTDRLEADGLVRRTADRADRRARLAVLTVAGRRACKRAVRVQRQAERDLWRTLSRTERQQLAVLLEKLRKTR
jgi:DNA-binding MarR family transcriptional regulator